MGRELVAGMQELGVLLDPANTAHAMPLVLTGPASAAAYFQRIDEFVALTLGAEARARYRIIIDDPTEWIQRTIVDSCTYEPNIGAIIAALLGPGDTFFDVGANIGYHTLGAAATGAHVYAFEPVPRLRNRLVGNLQMKDLGW